MAEPFASEGVGGAPKTDDQIVMMQLTTIRSIEEGCHEQKGHRNQ
jgi:hypothetical protein